MDTTDTDTDTDTNSDTDKKKKTGNFKGRYYTNEQLEKLYANIIK